MDYKTVEGPIGPFLIPNVLGCEMLTEQVWRGEYDHPGLPEVDVKSVVDIGGGWGAFAVLAYQKWGRDIQLTAYEPNAPAADYFALNAPTATLNRVAVTIDPAPFLRGDECWGSVRTWHVSESEIYGQHGGCAVRAIHPIDLPPCDILKIDAEGVEPEIIANYRWLAGLKALIYEFHHLDHKDHCRRMCSEAGMRQIKFCEGPTYGTDIWVR